jgi:hypothetical protein
VSVTGRVVDLHLRALDGIEVRINGGSPRFTDANGSFSMDGVRIPYDATVRDSLRHLSIIYRQLRRPDPTLELVGQDMRSGLWSSIEGRLSGGTGFPQPSNHYLIMGYLSPHVFADFNISDWAGSTGDYAINVPYSDPSFSGTVHALQIDLGSSDAAGPASYTGYGSRENVPMAAAGGKVTGQDLVMTTLQTDSINGTVVAPAGLSLASKQLLLTYRGPRPATTAIWTDHSTESPFKFRFARSSALSFGLTVDAYGPAGEVVYTKTQLEQAASSITITLPTPVAILAPADNATGVTASSEFRWSGPTGSVYVFLVPGRTGVTLVVTTETSLRLSDLKLTDITLTPGHAYTWTVFAYGPFASLDEAAGPLGFESSEDHLFSFTPHRTFQP